MRHRVRGKVGGRVRQMDGDARKGREKKKRRPSEREHSEGWLARDKLVVGFVWKGGRRVRLVGR